MQRLLDLLRNYIFLIPLVSLSAEEPWGKDADMLGHKMITMQALTCTTPIMGPLGELLIGFHQNIISPADGPRSHFIPSSSQYTLDAMRKYGFFHGFFLGCDRLMRENEDPWMYRTCTNPQGILMKYDPVR